MEVYEISPAVNRVANDSPSSRPYNADNAAPPEGTQKPSRRRQKRTPGRGHCSDRPVNPGWIEISATSPDFAGFAALQHVARRDQLAVGRNS